MKKITSILACVFLMGYTFNVAGSPRAVPKTEKAFIISNQDEQVASITFDINVNVVCFEYLNAEISLATINFDLENPAPAALLSTGPASAKNAFTAELKKPPRLSFNVARNLNLKNPAIYLDWGDSLT